MGFKQAWENPFKMFFLDKLSDEKPIRCNDEEADEGDVEEGEHVR